MTKAPRGLSVVITLILAFVFLHEQFTIKSIIVCILIGAGTLLMLYIHLPFSEGDTTNMFTLSTPGAF